MAKLLRVALNLISGKPEYKALMLGMNYAGKTTILYRLHEGNIVTTIPTIGFNVETIERGNVSLVLWDVGGGIKIPPLWPHYAVDCKGIIFVLDSTYRENVEEASKYLHNLLLVPDLLDLKVLVFANKQDVTNPMTAEEVVEKLSLRNLPQRHWHVQLCSAVTGDGIEAGIAWFCNAIIRTQAIGEAELSSQCKDLDPTTIEKK